jgi:hypothetical protein
MDHVGLMRTVAVLDYVGGDFELEQSDMIFPPFSDGSVATMESKADWVR